MPPVQSHSHSLSEIKVVLLDLSGVLYAGDNPIAGATKTLSWLRQQGYVVRFVTNTATESSTQILHKLHSMGFELDASELFTAPMAAKHYLQTHQLHPFCLLHPNLLAEFADLCSDKPNCVLLGDAQDDLNYANLNHAFQLLEQGMPLIGIGKNKYFMSHDGLQLDAGVFIHALEWASGKTATIMGKPDAHFFSEAVLSTGFSVNECLMIGDDVQSDVQGAMDAGLQAALVKTGKFKERDLEQLPKSAYLIDSIQGLPKLLKP
ncbi:TIGR01458 family HAD-type hydrolase [Thiomicrorhabdus sp. zzn3]|uniref:TIGR01458 family HAD-type hydrolase n=1 Tax=Thiomicrorhabdus sp. zzn3 TaxID=3039775 RepID=UPI0024367C48|nr:TIGR01458 family HAD-type hydrolase [Thiomicrorhabdus sp. zzn3]MDG6778110.1 TIGR01458 family HAD-type hydrolase [Thiomicrorhabdus sp. zzn3]